MHALLFMCSLLKVDTHKMKEIWLHDASSVDIITSTAACMRPCCTYTKNKYMLLRMRDTAVYKSASWIRENAMEDGESKSSCSQKGRVLMTTEA